MPVPRREICESFRFATVLSVAEHDLVDRLALTPVPIEPELAHADARLRGHRIAVDVRAYAGGPIAHARCATVVCGSGLEIASLLCVGRPELGLPILGAELIDRGREHALLAIDLVPTTPVASAARQLAPLGRRRRRWSDLPSAGSLPPWLAPFASPHHVFARLRRPRRAAALPVLRDFVDELVRLALGTAARPEQAESVAETTRSILAAQRTGEGAFGVLAQAFARDWTERWLADVAFPELR